MPQKRITIQALAEACQLSRNTVSKVFNERGRVPESTRQFVLAKARELGYHSRPQLSAAAAPAPPAVPAGPGGTIAVLSRSNPLNHHFGSMLMKAFTDTVCRWGYSVQIYELSNGEVDERRLPEGFSSESIRGVLCIELFDRPYLEMLAGLGLPVVSVDADCQVKLTPILCDVIIMENLSSVMALTRQLLAAGARSLGFVGDRLHCCSFRERWDGFCAALRDAGLEPDPRLCILEKDGSQYADPEWTLARLREMPRLPDAFLCANDYHAVKLIQALKKLGRRIPEDLMVAGFDDGPEAAVIDPSLTTVHIPSSEMGVHAAELLLGRIRNPERPYTMTYVRTTPVFRESTRR